MKNQVYAENPESQKDKICQNKQVTKMPSYKYLIKQVQNITLPHIDEKRFLLQVQIIEDPQVTPWELKIVITCSGSMLSEWDVPSRKEEQKFFYFYGKKFLEKKLEAGEIEKKENNRLDLDLDKEYREDPPFYLNEVHMRLNEWSDLIIVKRRIGF